MKRERVSVKKLGRKRKKAQEERMIFNPMKITAMLKEIGEEYDKKEAGLYYAGILLVAIILGLLLELNPLDLIFVLFVYVLFVPKIIYNQKKHAFEKKRFYDVNAYMSEMTQEFTSKGTIHKSLIETADTFTKGRMHETLYEAIDMIENSSGNFREVQENALKIIESKYDCEKIRNLHTYLLKSEQLGGNVESEFRIIEKQRKAWSKAVEEYYRKLEQNRLDGMVIYGGLLLFCAWFMHAFPEDLSIIGLPGIQILNTVMLALFVVFFVVLDTKLNTSLLKEAEVMSQERATELFTDIQNYDQKVEKKKYLKVVVLSIICSVLLIILKPTTFSFAMGIILTVFALNLHKIILMLKIYQVKKEIKKEFPKWLFDVALLMQRNSVDGAIQKSRENASPVLSAEVKRIGDILERRPADADAYMSFFADFNILMIENTMRSLRSLALGERGSNEVMVELMESNLQRLEKAEKDSLSRKGDLSSAVELVPVGLITIGTIGYCVGLLFVALNTVLSLVS